MLPWQKYVIPSFRRLFKDFLCCGVTAALVNANLKMLISTQPDILLPRKHYRKPQTSSPFLQAQSILPGGDFDLLILDVNLPDGSGLDLLREVRRCHSSVPVILLTANDLETDIVSRDRTRPRFSTSIRSSRCSVLLSSMGWPRRLGTRHPVCPGKRWHSSGTVYCVVPSAKHPAQQRL